MADEHLYDDTYHYIVKYYNSLTCPLKPTLGKQVCLCLRALQFGSKDAKVVARDGSLCLCNSMTEISPLCNPLLLTRSISALAWDVYCPRLFSSVVRSHRFKRCVQRRMTEHGLWCKVDCRRRSWYIQGYAGRGQPDLCGHGCVGVGLQSKVMLIMSGNLRIISCHLLAFNTQQLTSSSMSIALMI
jgi:hypothetical protein